MSAAGLDYSLPLEKLREIGQSELKVLCTFGRFGECILGPPLLAVPNKKGKILHFVHI